MCGYAQCVALTRAGDPQRYTASLQSQRAADCSIHLVVAAGQGRGALDPHLTHDLHALVKHADPWPGTREPVAECAPRVLAPARSDAHLDPSARDNVHRGGDLGYGRIPIPTRIRRPHPAGQRPGWSANVRMYRCQRGRGASLAGRTSRISWLHSMVESMVDACGWAADGLVINSKRNG